MQKALRAGDKHYRELFEDTLISARSLAQKDRAEALARLRERIKELTLLHYVGQLINADSLPLSDLLQAIVDLLPAAWRYSEITVGRIRYGDLEVTTSDFHVTRWLQRAVFSVSGGHEGTVEVCYLEERPVVDEGQFLVVERP